MSIDDFTKQAVKRKEGPTREARIQAIVQEYKTLVATTKAKLFTEGVHDLRSKLDDPTTELDYQAWRKAAALYMGAELVKDVFTYALAHEEEFKSVFDTTNGVVEDPTEIRIRGQELAQEIRASISAYNTLELNAAVELVEQAAEKPYIFASPVWDSGVLESDGVESLIEDIDAVHRVCTTQKRHKLAHILDDIIIFHREFNGREDRNYTSFRQELYDRYLNGQSNA